MIDSPMIYFMGGVYELDGDYHCQVGVLKLHTDDTITGKIFDSDSDCPVQEVEGALIIEGEKITIHFIKKPTEIRYVFDKADGVNHMVGKYRGHWRHGKEGLEFREYKERDAKMRLFGDI